MSSSTLWLILIIGLPPMMMLTQRGGHRGAWVAGWSRKATHPGHPMTRSVRAVPSCNRAPTTAAWPAMLTDRP